MYCACFGVSTWSLYLCFHSSLIAIKQCHEQYTWLLVISTLLHLYVNIFEVIEFPSIHDSTTKYSMPSFSRESSGQYVRSFDLHHRVSRIVNLNGSMCDLCLKYRYRDRVRQLKEELSHEQGQCTKLRFRKRCFGIKVPRINGQSC